MFNLGRFPEKWGWVKSNFKNIFTITILLLIFASISISAEEYTNNKSFTLKPFDVYLQRIDLPTPLLAEVFIETDRVITISYKDYNGVEKFETGRNFKVYFSSFFIKNLNEGAVIQFYNGTYSSESDKVILSGSLPVNVKLKVRRWSNM